jgi:hypothetical protein
MTCKFDPNTCSINCKKYLLCSYYSMQNQIIDLQSQVNFIYSTIADILKKSETSEIKIGLLESAFFKYVSDSDSIINYKESNKNEKEN